MEFLQCCSSETCEDGKGTQTIDGVVLPDGIEQVQVLHGSEMEAPTGMTSPDEVVQFP